MQRGSSDTAEAGAPERCATVRDAAVDLQTARVPLGRLTLQVRCKTASVCSSALKSVSNDVLMKHLCALVRPSTSASCWSALSHRSAAQRHISANRLVS